MLIPLPVAYGQVILNEVVCCGVLASDTRKLYVPSPVTMPLICT